MGSDTSQGVPTFFELGEISDKESLSHEQQTSQAIGRDRQESRPDKEPLSIGGDKAAQGEPKSKESLSLEERATSLYDAVTRNPLHREIHRKTLAFCDKQQILSDVESFIAACPEFSSASQSPYFLLHFIVDAGGIDSFELDVDGSVITPQQKEGLSEDEIDDLVVQFAYQTNEAGRVVAQRMSPQKRLEALLNTEQQYKETYLEVLRFLTKKHDFAAVDTLLRGRDVLMVGREADDRPIQPSVFIDKLEKTGAIYWEKGWIISSEGKDFLESLEGKER
jgi:hypothetical protein